MLDGNEANARSVRFVGDALRRREWARITLRQWQFAVRAERQKAFGLQRQRRRELLVQPVSEWKVTSKVQV